MPRQIVPPEQLSYETKEVEEVLQNETNNAAVALIAHAAIEHVLTSLLSKFMIDHPVSNNLLRDARAPLGSYSACCDIAFALGLIPEGMYDNLTIIGTIRNTFAHSRIKTTFSSDPIDKMCFRLYLPLSVDGLFRGNIPAFRENPRTKFTFVCMMIHTKLLLLALGTKRQELAPIWAWYKREESNTSKNLPKRKKQRVSNRSHTPDQKK